jgi:hypothetical protein
MIIRFEGRDLGFREIVEREKPQPKAIRRPKPPKYAPPPSHLRKVYDEFPTDLDIFWNRDLYFLSRVGERD